MAKGIFDGPVESFKPIPEGIYQGRVTKLEFKTSKAGNDYLNIKFTLPSLNGRKVWDKLMWHTEGAAKVMKGKLDSLGFTREERKQIDPEDHQSLISAVNAMAEGKVYDIKVIIDLEGYNKVKYFSDPNATDEGVDQLDATNPAPAGEVSDVDFWKNPSGK